MSQIRSEFIKKASLGTAALTFGGIAAGTSPRSYSRIIGANERIRIANVGVSSQGTVHMKAVVGFENTSVGFICDVDSRDCTKDS